MNTQPMGGERLEEIREAVAKQRRFMERNCRGQYITKTHSVTHTEELIAEVERLRADAARRYILKSDDDGHWYVVPADKDREAADYFEAVSKYWGEPSDENAREPDRPDWLEEVGGCPSLVTFTDPKIGAGF